MMTETKINQETANLRNICQLLQIEDKQNCDNKLELLRGISNKLDLIDSNTGDAADASVGLKTDNITESLAIPNMGQPNASRQTIDDRIWCELSKYNDMLQQEYSRRREILLSRLNCTVESFKWKSGSSANNGKDSESTLNQLIHQTYEQAQQLGLRLRPNVGIPSLLAAREDSFDSMANMIVSSNRINNLKRSLYQDDGSKNPANLKKIIIPNVPDRGGRTSEIRPPPMETLSSQQRGRSRSFRPRYRR